VRNANQIKRRWIYHLLAEDGTVLYIGCTVNPMHRLQSHRSKSWWKDVTRARWFNLGEIAGTEAVRVEAEDIIEHDPIHNMRWPDTGQKRLPYPTQLTQTIRKRRRPRARLPRHTGSFESRDE
jgi:hypothetical protein